MYGIRSCDTTSTFISSSGDVQSGQAVTTWNLGEGVDNQQVGNTWSGVGDIVSLSLSGDLNVFDVRIRDKAARVIQVGTSLFTSRAFPLADIVLAI